MVWECFTWLSVGPLVKIEGTYNKKGKLSQYPSNKIASIHWSKCVPWRSTVFFNRMAIWNTPQNLELGYGNKYRKFIGKYTQKHLKHKNIKVSGQNIKNYKICKSGIIKLFKFLVTKWSKFNLFPFIFMSS